MRISRASLRIKGASQMIGVCIKYAHENYGGMLQAYATISLLEKFGIKYELIRYDKSHSLAFKVKALSRIFNSIFLNDKVEVLKKKIGKKKHPEFAKNDAIRMQAFHDFASEKFINLAPVSVGYKQLCADSLKYSAVVTGSDQLWSPAGLSTNFFNLMFVDDSVRKISYASSFGVSNIPWYQKKRTKQFLNRFDYISMRENRGAEIVKELLGKNVPVVVDPVMMFTASEWDELIPQKQITEGEYIFAYFLGDNHEFRKAVKNLSKQTGLKIVALRHMDQYVPTDEQFGDEAPYNVGPVEFLNLLRRAKYVCTDSFHGSAFSIIYHKQFIVFNRYSNKSKHSKNSRIDTLCINLGVADRRYNSNFVRQIQIPIDYSSVDSNIKKLKQEAYDYLNDAFKGIK